MPTGGDTICGVNLPKGTVVGINAWAFHRNRDVFGDEVDCFRPERWIESDVEQLKEMRRNLFTVSPTLCPFYRFFQLSADVRFAYRSLVLAQELVLGETLHSSKYLESYWRSVGILTSGWRIQDASGMFGVAGLQNKRGWTWSSTNGVEAASMVPSLQLA